MARVPSRDRQALIDHSVRRSRRPARAAPDTTRRPRVTTPDPRLTSPGPRERSGAAPGRSRHRVASDRAATQRLREPATGERRRLAPDVADAGACRRANGEAPNPRSPQAGTTIGSASPSLAAGGVLTYFDGRLPARLPPSAARSAASRPAASIVRWRPWGRTLGLACEHDSLTTGDHAHDRSCQLRVPRSPTCAVGADGPQAASATAAPTVRRRCRRPRLPGDRRACRRMAMCRGYERLNTSRATGSTSRQSLSSRAVPSAGPTCDPPPAATTGSAPTSSYPPAPRRRLGAAGQVERKFAPDSRAG